MKLCLRDLDHLTKMAAYPYMVKTLKNSGPIKMKLTILQKGLEPIVYVQIMTLGWH